jgi:hypothetical protein
MIRNWPLFVGLICVALVLLDGCSTTQIAPPAQPTPTSINGAIADLAAIEKYNPVRVWKTGVWAVRAACYDFLNAEAIRSSQIGLASTGIGLGGVAAGSFLIAHGSPLGAAAATALSSLTQSFLSNYQQAGAIPYTSNTTTIIVKALNAEEAQVNADLPTTVEDAMSYVSDLWWWCSPGGYQWLVNESIATATISAGPPLSSAFASPPGPRERPQVRVNGR